jgi:hypothetical protein
MTRLHRSSAFLVSSLLGWSAVMAEETLTIDDRGSGSLVSSLGTQWRLVTDGVMGGVSEGTLAPHKADGKQCLRLGGEVSLQNRGGFIQAVLDLEGTAAFDASDYAGIELEVRGSNESYNLHLRTEDVWLPWQSYRASFQAPREWQRVRLPFSDFSGYRIGKPLDTSRLRRIGIAAIGRAFHADVCIGSVTFYRSPDKGDMP